ncbi:MAG: transglutaminase family protein [Verrucomicrobiota bacterium]
MQITDTYLRLGALTQFLGLFILLSMPVDAAYISLAKTPYDNQMNRIRHVITQADQGQTNLSKAQVEDWMKTIRGYRYRRSHTWQLPGETEKRRAGDCKDKALLLLDYMKSAGYSGTRLVIGKQNNRSKETHAWLEWKYQGEWLVLDPTFYPRPQSRDNLKSKYIREYIYLNSQKIAYIPYSVAVAGL